MPTASEFARDLALALDPSPVTWIDAQIRQNELGQPFQLFAHQRVILRRAFAFDEEGRLPYDTILYSCIKKKEPSRPGTLKTEEQKKAEEAAAAAIKKTDEAVKSLTKSMRAQAGTRRGVSCAPGCPRSSPLSSAFSPAAA